MARKKIGDIELDDFHYHEMMDRLSVVMDIVDRSLVQHPVGKIESDIKEEVSSALDHLFKAYQIAGQKRFKEDI